MSKHEIVLKKDILSFLKKLKKCNNVDYNEIRTDLVEHNSKISRMKLISNGVWFDTLHIKPKKGFETFMILLAHKWKADEVHWITTNKKNFVNAKDTRAPIPKDGWLRIWWD